MDEVTYDNKRGITRYGTRNMQTKRVSINDVFMSSIWWDDPQYTPRWILADLSGEVMIVLDTGEGVPPAHHLPPGMTFDTPHTG